MSEQPENLFKRNKILDMLQGDSQQPQEKPAAVNFRQSNEPFIYPHIGELDRLLQRFKERYSSPSVDNTL